MSQESPNEDGTENNLDPTVRSRPETQGVDLSSYTNQVAVTRMERAQAQWTKLLADGVRMATRPFDQFRNQF